MAVKFRGQLQGLDLIFVGLISLICILPDLVEGDGGYCYSDCCGSYDYGYCSNCCYSLSGGAITGIAVGVTFIITLVILICCCCIPGCIIYKRRNRIRSSPPQMIVLGQQNPGYYDAAGNYIVAQPMWTPAAGAPGPTGIANPSYPQQQFYQPGAANPPPYPQPQPPVSTSNF